MKRHFASFFYQYANINLIFISLKCNSSTLLFLNPDLEFLNALNSDAMIINDDANAALVTEWVPWYIPLQKFADQGVNLSNVSSMSIGFGNKQNPLGGGGEGHVLFDDIRQYRKEQQLGLNLETEYLLDATNLHNFKSLYRFIRNRSFFSCKQKKYQIILKVIHTNGRPIKTRFI